MAPDRGRKLLLGVALAVLIVVVGRAVWWASPDAPLPAAARGAKATAAAGRSPSETSDPDVHLDALAVDRPPVRAAQRNLFRYKPPPPPPRPAPPPQIVAAPPPVPTGPPPPPPVPPITLKFIGIVGTDKGQRLAVLSDGRGGMPFSGKEGDIIEGRYRLLRIGTESIEMAYLDGRGRQTIRLGS